MTRTIMRSIAEIRRAQQCHYGAVTVPLVRQRKEQAAAAVAAVARRRPARTDLPSATLARIARPFATAREIRDRLHDGGRTIVRLACADGCRPRVFASYPGALPDGLAELRDADTCLTNGDRCDRCGAGVRAVDGAGPAVWTAYRAAVARWKAHHDATGEWQDDALAAAWKAVTDAERRID